MDPDEYAEKFQSDLIEPVAAWMRGETFKSVREYTNIFEVRARAHTHTHTHTRGTA